jgi:hypothetical protein
MVPIGPGGLQSGFSTLRYVRKDKGQRGSFLALQVPAVPAVERGVRSQGCSP